MVYRKKYCFYKNEKKQNDLIKVENNYIAKTKVDVSFDKKYQKFICTYYLH